MKIYYDDELGLIVQPYGKFDQTLHLPLMANMAEHFFLWSHITVDFSSVSEIDESGIRLLILLQEKIQDETQKIKIINLTSKMHQQLVSNTLESMFELYQKADVKIA